MCWRSLKHIEDGIRNVFPIEGEDFRLMSSSEHGAFKVSKKYKGLTEELLMELTSDP